MEHHSMEPKIVQGKTGDEFLAELNRLEQPEVAEAWKIVMEFTHEVEHRGGAVLLAGGSVRDELFGLPVKDFDLEVYHLPFDEIKTLAEQYGPITEDAGKVFPVIKLHIGNNVIDIGQPRIEKKEGEGHNQYKTVAVPNMSAAEAVQRRDFTINALVKNPITGEIFDYVGGLDDVANKKLRVVNEKRFVEDSLRVLRGIQFAGRFGLTADQETKALMAEVAPRMENLTRDRLRLEWEKLFLKAEQPSHGLVLARDLGIFSQHPEIQKLADTPQDKEHHPEGDVWTHTKYVVDQAAAIAEREKLSDDDHVVTTLAAFGHDIGKATTTVEKDGRITSYGHETAGVEPMKRWMESQGFTRDTIARVLPLIQEHMNPAALYKTDTTVGLGDGPIRRLAMRLHPATIKQLVVLNEADHTGRGIPDEDYLIGPWLLERAEKLSILDKRPEPVISGESLRQLGYPQHSIIGELMRAAQQLADEKNMAGSEIMEQIKKYKKPEDALVALRELTK